MIARVVAYGTKSLDASRDWVRQRADRLRSIPGVERFDIVTQEEPPRAGAIIYFASRDALERYREERLPELEDAIAKSWGTGRAFEYVFEVEDI